MSGDREDDETESAQSATQVPLDVIPLHSTNLLTVLDERGTIHYESPAIERIYGFEQSQLVGEPVADYFHPADREHVLAAFERVVRGEAGDIEAVEYRHERADGTYCWVESSASATPTPQGLYVVNTRDISERRAREQELEHQNERLEEFASLVSHDLRNPLNVASIRLEQARETGDDTHLEEVANAHARMETLIADLLMLARAGSDSVNLEPIDLASIATACWQTAVSVGGTLQVETDREILADRLRLRQLLENLLGNAVTHGSTGDRPRPDSDRTSGAGQVTVTVGDLGTGDGFYVADNGPGIDSDQRDQVFTRGWSTADEGTGFGLTIVTEIVQSHGWEIDVTESAAGGARFEVSGVELA